MSSNESLKEDVNTHFEFGENWAAYSASIDQRRILEAEAALQQFLSASDIAGRTFLDLGSGSGIHSLAALNLGAKTVTAVDIDPHSVATTRRTLEEHAGSNGYECLLGNVFDLPLDEDAKFDIVYSWGVLHHTGDMWSAIEKAIERVRPGGKLIIAIYLKTRFCGFWKAEKKLFTRAPKVLRWPIVGIYCALSLLRVLFSGKNPIKHMTEYSNYRGMSWIHDCIDWLGGYPYESASAAEITRFVENRGGKLEKSIGTTPSIGLLGAGCAEYLFRCRDAPDLSQRNEFTKTHGTHG